MTKVIVVTTKELIILLASDQGLSPIAQIQSAQNKPGPTQQIG